MSEFEIDLSARFTAVNRVIEFLLCQYLGTFENKIDTLEFVRLQVQGDTATPTKGLIDVSDLERISERTRQEIDALFAKVQSSLDADRREQSALERPR